jgi:hypothetical protein
MGQRFLPSRGDAIEKSGNSYEGLQASTMWLLAAHHEIGAGDEGDPVPAELEATTTQL